MRNFTCPSLRTGNLKSTGSARYPSAAPVADVESPDIKGGLCVAYCYFRPLPLLVRRSRIPILKSGIRIDAIQSRKTTLIGLRVDTSILCTFDQYSYFMNTRSPTSEQTIRKVHITHLSKRGD